MPSTLIEGFDLINTLDRVIFTDWVSLLWNKHSSVFDSFTFSPESLSYLVIIIRVIVRLSVTSFLFFDHFSTKLSSAKLVILQISTNGETYIAYRIGPKIEPCTVPVKES